MPTTITMSGRARGGGEDCEYVVLADKKIDAYIKRLHAPNEVVIPSTKIALEFRFGLTSPRTISIKHKKGWSRQALVRAIANELAAMIAQRTNTWIKSLRGVKLYAVYYDTRKQSYCVELDVD